MFKSIRWSIQLWHASLLAVVLAGFGVASYYTVSQLRFQEVDAELERSVQLLAASRPEPRGSGGPGGPGGQGDGPNWRGGDFRGDRRDEFDRRGPGPSTNPGEQFWGRGRGRGGGGPGGRPGRDDWYRNVEIEISPTLAQRFSDTEPGSLYYAVFALDDTILQSSANAPAGIPVVALLAQDFGPPQPEPAQRRNRGDLREAFKYGPFGLRVLVGRSIIREETELRHLAWLLAAIGAGILVIGLAGGWIVSGRIVDPIHTIARTAKRISASNLSRRIDVAGTKSELGTLAGVLNDMFSRLDSAFQQQIRFTADASHELRTPLSVIHTHTQLALSRERSAEEYRKTIETCRRASTRMKDLVDSLLFLAGADAGKLTINPQHCDLGALIEDSVTMVTPLAAERKVTIESNLQSVKIDADPSRFSQVAINLLTNAIRYNREGGTIKISLNVEGDAAVMSIADSGVGIPEEHQPHIFERFYRVDKARSRDVGGSGLGLAICKSIVDAHGGNISFQSQVDLGTTFIVRLPLKNQPISPKPEN